MAISDSKESLRPSQASILWASSANSAIENWRVAHVGPYKANGQFIVNKYG